VIGVYATHEAAQGTVTALNRAGFDMAKVSIVGKGYGGDEHAHGLLAMGDRIKVWAGTGSLWGAAWALLLGAAVIVMPPVGIVVAAGPVVAALLAALEGAIVVGGVSALAAALASIGMSSEQAADYEAHIKADRFLVIVHGSRDDVERARAIATTAGHATPGPAAS
jgi:hypothetical protein